jgi:hypothetical protein
VRRPTVAEVVLVERTGGDDLRSGLARDRRLDHEVQIVENQRPIHGHSHGLIAAIEFPSVDALTAVTEVDAAMAQQVTGHLGLPVRAEIPGRRDDGQPPSSLPDCEAHFVEHGAIRVPQLDPPLANGLIGDGVTAVRAITGAGIRPDAELHGLAQTIALIPAVLNRGSGCRFDLRVEEHPPGRNLAVRSFTSPRPEGGAELRRDHRWHRGRFRERV